MSGLRLPRLYRIALPLAALLLILTALYLAADARGLAPAYARLYPLVFIVTALALLALAWAIARRVWILRRQLRQQEPGARLTRRLLVLLVLLALPPLLLVYGFGVRFISTTVDSWLPANNLGALQDALAISQRYLDERGELARTAARQIRAQLELASETGLDDAVEQALDASGVEQIVVFEDDGRIRAVAAARPGLLFSRPPSDEARLALRRRADHLTIERGEGGLYILVLQRLTGARNLQVRLGLPAEAAGQALRVEAAVHDSARALYLRDALKLSFSLILSLVFLLSLLAAVLLSFGLARRLMDPIGRLAQATRRIAGGDFDTRLPAAGDDELGMLVDAFNQMTDRLELSRRQLRDSATEAEHQRAFLETILAHLSSGVLVVDADRQLRHANAAAGEILGLDAAAWPAGALPELGRQVPQAAGLLRALLRQLDAGALEWREEIGMAEPGQPGALLLRGVRLPDGGAVVIFDDATLIDRARRDAAWAEVARRLAHEIKNPLTPIQLAAERLRRRVLPKLDASDGQVLDRATHTIVAQVDALKSMVDQFGDYAQPVGLKLEALDLAGLARDVLDLYEHDERLELAHDLPADLPRVQADAGRIRQVLHNLIKNAIEACENQPHCRIEVVARLAAGERQAWVELAVLDDGPGLPEGFDAGWFEPYRSTKPRGTGLGLAIVARIAREHAGELRAERRPGGGSRFTLRLPVQGPLAA